MKDKAVYMSPEAAILLDEVRSLRRMFWMMLVIIIASLLLNASRTYLVSTQINQLQAENVRLNKEMGKCVTHAK